MKDIKLKDYGKILLHNKTLIIVAVIVVSIITMGISFLLPKWYRAQATIMPPSEDSGSFGSLSAGLTSFSLGGLFGDNSDQQRIIAILKSRTLLQLMDQKFDFQKKYKTKFKFQTYEKLNSNLRFEIGEQSQIIVSLIDKEQDRVSKMLSYALTCLDSINIHLNQKQASKQRIFIEERIDLIRDSLFALEGYIADFMKKNNVMSISDQMSSEITEAADLKARIVSKEIELKIQREYVSENRPEVERLKAELGLLKQNYKELFFSGNDDLNINLNNIQDIELQYIQLKRNVQYYEALLQYLGPQYEQAKIEEVKDTPTIQVIDQPERPEWKYKPKRIMLVIKTDFIFCIFLLLYILIRNRRKLFHG